MDNSKHSNLSKNTPNRQLQRILLANVIIWKWYGIQVQLYVYEYTIKETRANNIRNLYLMHTFMSTLFVLQPNAYMR